MKKSILLLLTLSAVFWSFEAKAVITASNAIGHPVVQMTVGDIIDMNVHEYAKQTGQRVSVKERIVFKMIKSKLKSEVRKGNLTKSDSPAQVVDESGGSFSLLAFLLALFLSLLGFLIVWLFMGRGALKSALWGLILSFIIYGSLFFL